MSFIHGRPVECTTGDAAIAGRPIEVPQAVIDARSNVLHADDAFLGGGFVSNYTGAGVFGAENVNLFHGGVSDPSLFCFFADQSFITVNATIQGTTSFCREGRPLSAQEVLFLWVNITDPPLFPAPSLETEMDSLYALMQSHLANTGVDVVFLRDTAFLSMFFDACYRPPSRREFSGKLLVMRKGSPLGYGEFGNNPADLSSFIASGIALVQALSGDQTKFKLFYAFDHIIGPDPAITGGDPVTLAEYNNADDVASSDFDAQAVGDNRFNFSHQPSLSTAEVDDFFGL